VIDDAIQLLTWRGRSESVSFGLTVPQECRTGVYIGTVTVAVDSVPIGLIRLRIRVEVRDSPRSRTLPLEPISIDARRFTLAFLAYASTDRNKVLARVQMLRLVGIRYFQDVLDLEPGDRWERKLYRYIDECDLFLLFWSTAASTSKWVLMEVRYAVKRKGGN